MNAQDDGVEADVIDDEEETSGEEDTLSMEYLIGLAARLAEPPEHEAGGGRWRKGQSGNPLGRPRRNAAGGRARAPVPVYRRATGTPLAG